MSNTNQENENTETGDTGKDIDGAPFMVGHVHLKVSNLERSVGFYTEILGLEVTEVYDRFTFLSWGERHHDIALQEVGEDAPPPSRGVGLYHAALEVETGEELADIYRSLVERQIRVSPVDHGISKAIYFDDPDGNGLEVYLDTREENDQYDWQGVNRGFDPTDLY